MSLTTTKRFNTNAMEQASFYTADGEPRINIEGIVEVAGVSDINVDVTSVSGNYLIGKSGSATNADFRATRSGTSAITLSHYPDYAAGGFIADDIEFVRQLEIGGAVVETYSRDDVTLTLIADVLTVTGGSFAASDTFVIGTNVPRIDLDSPDLEFTSNYTGKLTGGNGDFDIEHTGADTLTISTFPVGISAFVAADVGLIRQVTLLGVWVADHTPANSTITITGAVITVAEAVFGATDIFTLFTTVARSSSGGVSGAGGGSIVYTNAAGDFVATINDGAKTITITALPFTLEDIHVVGGTIKKIAVTTDVVTNVPLTDVSVAGGVITLNDAENFVTGDIVYVTLIGPDKWYDSALDNAKTNTQNPDYAHYTDVETLISEADLGVTGTAAAGSDQNTLVATGLMDAENVAVGYEAYDEEEDVAVTLNSITNINTAETDNVTTDWLGDTYWLPEVKRFEIPFDGYKYMIIQYKVVSGDDNRASMKIYSTLNESADATDDTDWIDESEVLLGSEDGYDLTYLALQADGESAGAIVTRENSIKIDSPTMPLKWMIKIVGEVLDGAGGAAANQDFDILIRKFY